MGWSWTWARRPAVRCQNYPRRPRPETVDKVSVRENSWGLHTSSNSHRSSRRVWWHSQKSSTLSEAAFHKRDSYFSLMLMLLSRGARDETKIDKFNNLDMSCCLCTTETCDNPIYQHLLNNSSRCLIRLTSETPSNTCFNNISTYLTAVPIILLNQNKPRWSSEITAKKLHKPQIWLHFRTSYLQVHIHTDDQ